MEGHDRLSSYINSLYSGNTPLLDRIEREALQNKVPVIRREMQSLLRTLLEISKPSDILEIGTATGFSAVFMCTYTAPDTKITTIEKYDKRIPEAKRNFRRAGVEDRVTLLEGEAGDFLRTMDQRFDFIFMDAAKGQYIHFLKDVERLLVPGGVLLSDNVLQGGDVLESRFAVERRDRTIHARMREYLYALTHDPGLVTTVLEIGDGAALSVKREMTDEET